MFFCQIFVNVEFYFEESKCSAIATIGSALLNVVLNVLIIPIMGYLAAGYTTLASYILFAVAHYIFFRVVCKKNDCSRELIDIRKMLLIGIAFFILMAILIIGYKIYFIRYAFIFMVCSILFVCRKKINLKDIIKK